jgi:hypothetical protein
MTKNQIEPKKKPVPTSVYLRKEVRAEVEKIAEAEGVTVHAIMAYGISFFVRQYKAGKVKLETEDRPKRLKLGI